MHTLSRLAVGLLIVAGISSTREASAYVHTVTPQGCHELHWAKSCVFLTADASGSSDMPLEDVERITRQAVSSWSTATASESFLRLDYVAASGPREAASDAWQVIKFRTDTWCHPADATGPAICYDASATALTTVSYVNDASDPANDGRILDADIELNAVGNFFYDADSGKPVGAGERRPMDLRNTLTHELGHLQGLDHTCRASAWSMPACTRDGKGDEVVDCADVEAHHATDASLGAVYASTMYPSAQPSETDKRTPKTDDIAAIASLYPTSEDPNICAMPGEEPAAAVATPPTARAGCSASRASGTGGWSWMAVLGLVALARRRRLLYTRHAP
ncbi:MAG: peptidase and matrixin and adamalysin [Myxococcaceae bacterium]|nr:peptidase and matrixin and adamalysin [Myxococcaceae bacterium]